ncbi:hypothetical protein LXA43DRAFT_1093922 [Ganoderma leucocontextum]|nr:hypothetical protein LXA43DRAFT_1093922 [Ganoderma leucocontextum]
MQNDTNQTRSPGFLILNYIEPKSAVECRDYDIIHNGWSQLRGPVSSETGQEQDPDAFSSPSPISPTSTMYDTEARVPFLLDLSFCLPGHILVQGSLTDVLAESDAEDTADTSSKAGKLIRAAAPGPLPALDTSDLTVITEIPQGVWVALTSESADCVGYYAQVSLYRNENQRWMTPLALHIDTELKSFIAAIKNALPLVDTEGGHVLYFCLRRKDVPGGAPNNVPGGVLVSKSWMSINNWPCAAVPKWSPPIPICSTDPKINEYLWKAELASIAFGRLNGSQPDFRFTFPNGPVHVLFDTGSSGSWVPSALVRYLRTTVFPTPENIQIDTQRGDSSSIEDEDRGPEYYIPRDIDTIQWTVKLEFKGTDGSPLVVTCPAYPFLGCEAAGEAVRTVYKEGLLFCAPEKDPRFVLGANFFQSMLVALHAPEYGDPYVRVAWPRANTTDGVFVPPPIRRR